MPPARIGINFDPNGQTDAEWRKWLLKECGPQGASVSEAGESLVFDVGGTQTEVVPIPWDFGGVFEKLEDKRALERGILAVMAAAAPDDARLVESLLDRIQAESRQATRTSAVKLWNAVRRPDMDTVGFVAQVFGQDHELERPLSSLLAGSGFLKGLECFLRPLSGIPGNAGIPACSSGSIQGPG